MPEITKRRPGSHRAPANTKDTGDIVRRARDDGAEMYARRQWERYWRRYVDADQCSSLRIARAVAAADRAADRYRKGAA